MIKVQKPMSEAVALEAQADLPATNLVTQSSDVPATTQPAKKPYAAVAGKISVKGIFTRVRKVKHIEIYAAVAAIAIMVLIFISSIGGGAAKKQTNAATLTSVEDHYVREMEAKLVSVLSMVRGAGRVEAMVTAVGSATLEIAYNIDEKSVTQSGNGGVSTTTTTVVKTPVLINGKEALVLMEVKPKLKGVVIVAAGAYDPAVRLGLLRAVQALVSDPTVIVEVLTRK